MKQNLDNTLFVYTRSCGSSCVQERKKKDSRACTIDHAGDAEGKGA